MKTYRVVTFQSASVIQELLEHGRYYADINKSRCGYFEKEDYDLCDGKVPIWVFQHPALKTTNITPKQWTDLMFEFMCESGLGDLSGYYMLEILLHNQPPKGITHNASSLACVIPHISLDDVADIYIVSPTSDERFKAITPIYLYRQDVLFNKHTVYSLCDYKYDKSRNIKLSDYQDASQYYI